eukprot:3556273-Amphidinium_carterae.1
MLGTTSYTGTRSKAEEFITWVLSSCTYCFLTDVPVRIKDAACAVVGRFLGKRPATGIWQPVYLVYENVAVHIHVPNMIVLSPRMYLVFLACARTKNVLSLYMLEMHETWLNASLLTAVFA